MAFRVRKDAMRWFKEISGKDPFKTDFDVYYFCLVVGIFSGRTSDDQDGESTKEIVRYFVGDYKSVQRLLIGLLILAVLKRHGITLTEKRDVQRIVKLLVDQQAQNGLTEEGERLLNSYASGGFDYIAERRSTKPYSAEEFFRDFHSLVGETLLEKSLMHH